MNEVKTVAAALKFGAIRNRDNTTITASDRLVSAFLSVLASENANFQSGLGLTLSDGIFKSDYRSAASAFPCWINLKLPPKLSPKRESDEQLRSAANEEVNVPKWA